MNLKKPFKNTSKKTVLSCSTSWDGKISTVPVSGEIWSSELIYFSPGFMFAVMEIFIWNKFLCLFLCSSAKCVETANERKKGTNGARQCELWVLEMNESMTWCCHVLLHPLVKHRLLAAAAAAMLESADFHILSQTLIRNQTPPTHTSSNCVLITRRDLFMEMIMNNQRVEFQFPFSLLLTHSTRILNLDSIRNLKCDVKGTVFIWLVSRKLSEMWRQQIKANCRFLSVPILRPHA